jgi:hypothetical protein
LSTQTAENNHPADHLDAEIASSARLILYEPPAIPASPIRCPSAILDSMNGPAHQIRTVFNYRIVRFYFAFLLQQHAMLENIQSVGTK